MGFFAGDHLRRAGLWPFGPVDTACGCEGRSESQGNTKNDKSVESHGEKSPELK
jgi:hypothetical protein